MSDTNYDLEFNKLNALPSGVTTFDNCGFINCDFSEQDLSNINFIECAFEQCNLSLTALDNTKFNSVSFSACKLMGMRFDTCNPFGFAIHCSDCVLNHSVFYNTALSQSSFKNCKLVESDFTDCNAEKTVITDCDLAGAIFENCNFYKVNFKGTVNLILNPETNNIKEASFSLECLPGLLAHLNIHIHSN